MLEFTTDLVIVAPPAKVLDAFFDAKALAVWWQAKHAVCVPRPLGSYAVEWEPTEWRDDILGRQRPMHVMTLRQITEAPGTLAQ